jgi:hypothetical protein
MTTSPQILRGNLHPILETQDESQKKVVEADGKHVSEDMLAILPEKGTSLHQNRIPWVEGEGWV